MGSIVDTFMAEDRVTVKFSDFYVMIKGYTERELLMNGARCNVPHQYMREMMVGVGDKKSDVNLIFGKKKTSKGEQES